NNATKTRQLQSDATTQAKHSSYKTTQQRSQNTAVTKRRNKAPPTSACHTKATAQRHQAEAACGTFRIEKLGCYTNN
ncbi:MAG: hypothetical protein SPJ21_09145, partial [Prevotella sp.]|nr:hypothetical protein [Prevotella sp.]